MDTASLADTPFAALTFIAAPALLTNSSSLLANSVTMRFLRTREIMRELYVRAGTEIPHDELDLVIQEVERVEKQASCLLRALYSVYVALGSFASATLITLVATSVAVAVGGSYTMFLAWVGVALGALGVGGLVVGSVNLVQATRISLSNIMAEAERVRAKRVTRP